MRTLAKTKQLAEVLKGFDARKCLIIADGEHQQTLLRLAKNIPNVNILPSAGLNVYSIIKS